MPLFTAELIFGDVNTVLIPTDAILIVFLLILFSLLGYAFHNIINQETNQFAQKLDENSNLELVKDKLENQFTLEATKQEQEQEIVDKLRMNKLNFLSPSKLLGLGSLAVVAIGGGSLIGLQNVQKSYEGVNTSQVNIKLENQLTKSPLSIVDLKSFDQTQTNIKKISYINPLLSTIKSSKYNKDYQIKDKQINNNFSF